MSSDDYEVGYGKPPKQTRFKPGQSGNPKGRPRKPKKLYATTMEVVRQLLIDAMEQEITITMNGRSRKVLGIVALFNQLLAKAVKGDMRSLKLAIDLYLKCVTDDQSDRAELLKLLIERDVDNGMTYAETMSKYMAGDMTVGGKPRKEIDPLS